MEEEQGKGTRENDREGKREGGREGGKEGGAVEFSKHFNMSDTFF